MRDTDQNSAETVSPEDTLDAPAAREMTDGGWTFATQAQYDPSDSRDLTTVIVSTIADAEDTAIVEIKNPPLYEVIDVAGIDDVLFDHSPITQNGTNSTVEFRYNDYKVSVETDGWVTVFRRFEDSAADEE
ncbi:HalOD1 output domain-containing protein [Haloprofundus halobius]|uniref:HalOD1 output domain-containing protein n=1 Tax=Haloprofundus halobius TaxID=2876194 RepID=UPI001CCD1244|nr:HalOD1 output domain-containing protein [Haloprofundus halobius]